MLNTLLQRAQANQYSDFAGSHLQVQVPISLDILNSLIQESIKKIEALEEVRIHEIVGDKIILLIRTNIVTFKERIITGKIIENINLNKPAVQIEILDGLGFTGRKLVAMALPDSMELEDRVLCFSLHHFLFTTEQSKQLLKLVKQVTIQTRQPRFLLTFTIQK